jgi:hypothetical protein
MKKISQGKDQSLILYENIEMYRSVYKDLLKKYQLLYESMENHFDTLGVSTKGKVLEDSFSTCGKCRKKMMLKNSSENTKFLFCSTCKDSFIVPKSKLFVFHTTLQWEYCKSMIILVHCVNIK